jgi:hypothetical protein
MKYFNTLFRLSISLVIIVSAQTVPVGKGSYGTTNKLNPVRSLFLLQVHHIVEPIYHIDVLLTKTCLKGFFI